ncbi:MAG: peptidylprolyl isomerase [Parahaliea sp.]
MKATQNTVVTFHYSIHNDQNEELENSRDSEPSAYLHGAGNILPALEAVLTDHKAGEQIEVTLEPGEAYGLRNTGRVQKVPVKHLLYSGKLRPGMVVQLNTSQGRHPVTAIKVGRHSATVDTNHPLAGQTLHFCIDIVDVREATTEELDHGHVHGPGGHHH